MVEFDVVDEEGASHGPREPLGQAPDGSLPLADREWLHVDPWGISNWVWVLLLWPLAAVVIVFAVFWTLWIFGWTSVTDLGNHGFPGYSTNFFIGLASPIAAIPLGSALQWWHRRDRGGQAPRMGRNLALAMVVLIPSAAFSLGFYVLPPLGILAGLLLGPVGTYLWRREPVFPFLVSSAVFLVVLSSTLFITADAHEVARFGWWGWGIGPWFVSSGAVLLVLLRPVTSRGEDRPSGWRYYTGGVCILVWIAGMLAVVERLLAGLLASLLL